MNPASAGVGELAERASGLLVPAHLAHQTEEPASVPDVAARDADGRRRVVLVKDVRKGFTRCAVALDQSDLAFVLVCKTRRKTVKMATDLSYPARKIPVEVVEEIPGACGEVMVREDEGGPDPGFGCQCTRVHFTTGGI